MSAHDKISDLRFGFAPLPDSAPGFDPVGDAKALILAGTPSPATTPIPGMQVLGARRPGQRFVVRIPDDWNGRLVVAGTPATRSEFANDAIWSDFVLSRGYAFASSNKGVPYNAIVEDAAKTPSPGAAYPVPFDAASLESGAKVIRLGVLDPHHVSPAEWDDDYADLVTVSKTIVDARTGKAPQHTYAVGLSNGGAQVRTLLERHPELVDGGVEWSAVYWSPESSILDYLPPFLRHMPDYVSSGFADPSAHDAIVAAGFADDRKQDNAAHPSLWLDYYSNVPPFYADITTFLYGLLVDPEAASTFSTPPCVPSASDPKRLPGTCNGSGLALPQNRAAYRPSAAARAAIARFAHTGRIGKPLVAIAGDADTFITPQRNARPYLDAVARAGKSRLYHQYIVGGGTHVDTFVAFGYGLQPQLPFAWAAFDQLVAIVEHGFNPANEGEARSVKHPDEIAHV